MLSIFRQRQKGSQFHDCQLLRVHGAAPIDEAVLLHRSKGRMLPLGFLCQDHVNMAQENQRPFSRRAVCPTFIRHIFISRKAGQEIAPAGSALVNRRIDPFLFKNLLNIIKRPFFISRWIGGINTDQVL